MNEQQPQDPSPETPAPATGGSGLEPRIAGALSYFLGAITGILFFILDRDDDFVRFHAAQSIVVCLALIILAVALSVLSAVLSVVPVLGVLLSVLLSLGLWLAGFVLWLFLMWKAYQGEKWEVPVVDTWTRRLAEEAAAGPR